MERTQGCTTQVLVHTHRVRNIFPIHLFPNVYGIVCKMVYNYQLLSTQTKKNVCLTVKIYIFVCFALFCSSSESQGFKFRKMHPFLMIDYALKMLIKSARAQQIPFWATVVTSSHSDQKQQHWSWRISRGISGKGDMNVFVSKLPQNKKESGFPVGGLSDKWCPASHSPKRPALAPARKQDLSTSHQGSASAMGSDTFLLMPNPNKV